MKYLTILLIIFGTSVKAQMVISKAGDPTAGQPAHPSAMLEIRASDKGVIFPTVALDSLSDTKGFTNLEEGTVVLNTTTNATHPNKIPISKPSLAVWNGSRWMLTYTKENVVLDLDKVRNFTSISNSAVDFNGTISTNPAGFSLGQGTTDWNLLVSSSSVTQRPSFEFDHNLAIQRMVIDVEGMASVDNRAFSYAVGIFVEGKLVSAKRFVQHALSSSTCYYQKFNMRAILTQDMIVNGAPILNKLAGQTYLVEVRVRRLADELNENYSRISFGGPVSGCTNINTDIARAYMNVLTIERRIIN